MKTFILSLSLCSVVLTCRSQPEPIIEFGDIIVTDVSLAFSIIFESIFPTPEEFYGVQEVEGEDQTWDQSNLDESKPVAEPTKTVISCDEVPEASIFLDCTHIYNQSVGSFVDYNSVTQFDEPNLYEIGITNNSTGEMQVSTCSQNKVLLEFPIEYGNNSTTSFSCGPAELGTGFQTEEVGTRSMLVDGWGTLILPAFTFENVLRRRIIEEGNMNNYFNGSLLSTIVFTRTTYEFLKAGYSFPVANFIETQLDNNPASYSADYMIKGFITELDENDSATNGWEVFPNPVNGSDLTLSYSELKTQDLRLTLYSFDGRLVHEQKAFVKSDLGQIEILLPNISKGLYFLIAQSEEVKRTFKIQVE